MVTRSLDHSLPRRGVFWSLALGGFGAGRLAMNPNRSADQSTARSQDVSNPAASVFGEDVSDHGATFSPATLTEKFDSLEAAQTTYPHVTSLTQTVDWAATQAAIYAAERPAGGGVVRHPGTGHLHLGGSRLKFMTAGLIGTGKMSSVLSWDSPDGGADFGVVDGTATQLSYPSPVSAVRFQGNGVARDLVAIGAQADPDWSSVDIRSASSRGSLLRLAQTQNGYFAKTVSVDGGRCLDLDYGANGNTFIGCLFGRGGKDLIRINDAIPDSQGIAAGNNAPGRNLFIGTYIENTQRRTRTLIRIHGGQQNSFQDCRINHTWASSIPLITVEQNKQKGYGLSDFRNLTFARCRFGGIPGRSSETTILDQGVSAPVTFDDCMTNAGIASTAFSSSSPTEVRSRYLGDHAMGSGWLTDNGEASVVLADDYDVTLGNPYGRSPLTIPLLRGERYAVTAYLVLSGAKRSTCSLSILPAGEKGIAGHWSLNGGGTGNDRDDGGAASQARNPWAAAPVQLRGPDQLVAVAPVGFARAISDNSLTVTFRREPSDQPGLILRAGSRLTVKKV